MQTRYENAERTNLEPQIPPPSMYYVQLLKRYPAKLSKLSINASKRIKYVYNMCDQTLKLDPQSTSAMQFHKKRLSILKWPCEGNSNVHQKLFTNSKRCHRKREKSVEDDKTKEINLSRLSKSQYTPETFLAYTH